MRLLSRWAVIGGLFAGAAASPTWAQWSNDPSQNVTVADGAGDQATPIVRAAVDGGAWVYFYDSSLGSGLKPVVQRMTATGSRVFPGNGVLLANRTNSASFTADMKVAVDGTAYAIFDDNGSTVTVQRINVDGTLPWGATGVQLANLGGSFGNRLAICGDGTIVCMGTVSNVLQFARINSSDGTLVAGETWSLAEASRGQLASDIVGSGPGGDVISLWVRSETTNTVTSRKGLKIQKWNSTHQPQWSGAGGPGTAVDVYTTIASPNRSIQSGYFPPIVPDGSGGAIVAWYDAGAARNAWLQHVNSDGTQRFPQDGLAMSTVTSATEYRLSASCAYDSTVGEYIVAYERSNPTQSQFGMGAQRISSEGVRLWPVGGAGEGLNLIPVAAGNNHKSFINANSGPNRDAMITWLEYTGASGPMLVNSTRLDNQGAFVWSPGFLTVCNTATSKGRLGVVTSASSSMLLAGWEDSGAGNKDIKMQNVNFAGTLGRPPCPADLNGDFNVNLTDLAILLAHFGLSGQTAADGDLNGDGDVNLTDLAALLAAFGTACP